MLVIVTENLPIKIQGYLKLWCLELKTNVFVTGITKKNLKVLIKNIEKIINKKLKITIIEDINKPPYYNFLTNLN